MASALCHDSAGRGEVHAEFFGRYKEIVFGVTDDREKDLRMGTLKERYLNTEDLYSRPFRRFFTTRLPDVLRRLHKAERSTFGTFREMAAIACYHVFAEGVVAETAYFAFEKALATKDGDTLPTILKGISRASQLFFSKSLPPRPAPLQSR